MSEQTHILDALSNIIKERKVNPSQNSYTAALMDKGLDKILRKIGEEATEVVIAAQGGNREAIIYESADLVFHLLVLLGYRDIPVEELYDELRRRFGISGLEEKNSRQ